MKRILVTGGLGFIGSHLGRRLIAEGHAVTLLDVLTPQIHGEIPRPDVPDGATVLRLDIRQLEERPELLEGVDVVFHLAAETGTAQSMYQMRHYVNVNASGTASLLEAIAKCSKRPKRVVLSSSRSVYGEGAYAAPCDASLIVQPAPRSCAQLEARQWEHTNARGEPLHAVATPESLLMAPGSLYAASKGAQELLLTSVSGALGLKTTVLRFQNVYGEGQSLRNPYTGIISIFYNRARQGLEIPIYEDGLESRDFVHVDDAVSALVRAMDSDIIDGAVVNVGSGVATSVLHLSRTLLTAAKLTVPIRVTGQYRLGDIRHCFADLDRLESVLGLKPQITLIEGLHRFCAWAATQPVHHDKSDLATEELRRRGLTNS